MLSRTVYSEPLQSLYNHRLKKINIAILASNSRCHVGQGSQIQGAQADEPLLSQQQGFRTKLEGGAVCCPPLPESTQLIAGAAEGSTCGPSN